MTKRPRYVELQGAETNNKGAHLMALAVLAQFRKWDEDIEACVYPTRVPEALRADLLPALRIFPPPLARKRTEALKRQARRLVARVALSQADMRRYGLIERSQIDDLLDISGYAYGDPWPRAGERVAVAEHYAKAGKPVVLLPQMLGPFETDRAREEFRRLVRASRLIFARDETSLEQARAVVPDTTKLHRAPDITIGFAAPDPCRSWDERSEIVVVPNDKVLTKTGQWGSRYVPRLVELVRRLRAEQHPVRILVHEGGAGDQSLAARMAAGAADADVSVTADPDPLALKRILGGAKVVVGSRFHALVSALSSGTPAVALGWAHKYQMLQRDFGVPELQHRPSDPDAHLFETALSLLERETWHRKQGTILERRAAMQLELESMWVRVAVELRIP